MGMTENAILNLEKNCVSDAKADEMIDRFRHVTPPVVRPDMLEGIGGRIRRARLRTGLTIAQAAEKIGVSYARMSQMEHGQVTERQSAVILAMLEKLAVQRRS